ncbi:MAG: recombinase family protein [Methylobacterium sp.]|nr:recombinase family protein [Methylobacterium sp.]
MPRTFAYLRVSTPGQTTDNQLTEIQAAGFTIEPRRLVTETVSGSIAASQRRGFARLLDRLVQFPLTPDRNRRQRSSLRTRLG